MPGVNVKVQRCSTFTLMRTRDTSYIASNLLTRVKLHVYASKDYAAVEIYLKTDTYVQTQCFF